MAPHPELVRMYLRISEFPSVSPLLAVCDSNLLSR